jgi:tryptophan 2,3-dioxygenase
VTVEERIDMQELDDWLAALDRRGFPYDAVVREYHKVGKHFVPSELLDALSQARESVHLLAAFLDVVLDKRDGTYDYRTYIALDLLPLPGADGTSDPDAAQRQCDRLLVQLVADMLRFELDVLDGRTQLFPQQRPDNSILAKRLRLGLRAVEPMSSRLGIHLPDYAKDPPGQARVLCKFAERDRTPAEGRALSLSDLPVYVVHDEYMFIRVLQSFECTFAFLTVCLRAAIDDVAAGRVGVAIGRLTAARSALREAARLFSLLATMQVESFRTFRLYTEGASAIQSRNYKMVESLCRTPDAPRLHSAAYQSVPDVRADVLEGQVTLDNVVREAVTESRIDQEQARDLQDAMRSFGATLLQWRQTHYSLAVRMLGERSGTGYTEGTPYLDGVRSVPVFTTSGADESEVRGG